MHLDILFRTCSRGNLKRFIDAPKKEISLACFNSLLASIENAHKELPELSIKLHILDDHSDLDMVDYMRDKIKSLTYSALLIPLTETGNNASLRANLKYAEENCRDLIYFVEDDYLHTESAITEMILAYTDFTTKRGKSVVISPCDHVTEYWDPDINDPKRSLCRVVMGKQRHWRTTHGTPATYLIDQRIFKTYKDLYEKYTHYDPYENITENNTINLIYEKEDCFSPIPSLTAHITHVGNSAPFFDWRSLWERYRLR